MRRGLMKVTVGEGLQEYGSIDNRGGGIGNARARNVLSTCHGHAHFMSALGCSTIHLHHGLRRQRSIPSLGQLVRYEEI